MSDWFEQKQQQMAATAREEETERDVRRQILVTVPHFWDVMIQAIQVGAKKWNAHKGRDEIYMLDASGIADTKSVNLAGPSDRISLRFSYNVPRIDYASENGMPRGACTFTLENGQVRMVSDDIMAESMLPSDAAGFFLNFVLHG
ncbi:MAG TPA: hypothetical protein DC054_09800 [Blastocatellia bacterium]|nr:hypothetical protein [Blastocatellia bacterium]